MLTLAKYPMSHAQNHHCPLTYSRGDVDPYFFQIQKDMIPFFQLVDKTKKKNIFQIQSCKFLMTLS